MSERGGANRAARLREKRSKPRQGPGTMVCGSTTGIRICFEQGPNTIRAPLLGPLRTDQTHSLGWRPRIKRMGRGIWTEFTEWNKIDFANPVYSVEKSIRVYSCSFVIN